MVYDEPRIITCKSCGQKLRIPRAGSYRCPKCKTTGKIGGAQRYEDILRQIKNILPAGHIGANKDKVAVTILIVAFIAIVVWAWRDNRSNAQPTNFNIPQNSTYTPPVVQQLPEQPLPRNGSVRISTGRVGDAPFKISTKPGGHNLVKLINLSDSSEVISIFVQDGRTVEVNIPVGVYQMKIASGTKWYGNKNKFGRDGSYSTANEALTFAYDGDKIKGHEIKLFGVINGNLKTKEINPEDF